MKEFPQDAWESVERAIRPVLDEIWKRGEIPFHNPHDNIYAHATNIRTLSDLLLHTGPDIETQRTLHTHLHLLTVVCVFTLAVTKSTRVTEWLKDKLERGENEKE